MTTSNGGSSGRSRVDVRHDLRLPRHRRRIGPENVGVAALLERMDEVIERVGIGYDVTIAPRYENDEHAIHVILVIALKYDRTKTETKCH